MTRAEFVLLAAGLALGGCVGAAGAWWLHRRTRVSPRSLYALAPAALAVFALAVAQRRAGPIVLAGPLAAAATVAAGAARRWRLAALGAGGELREFELARHGVWRALRPRALRGWWAGRARGERTYIASQGELVRVRPWPVGEPCVPMSADGRGRLPRRAGQHLLIVGATGAGKTVSARRWLAARILADGVGVLATDPKGDRALERDLRAAAQVAGRPFVLLDPREPQTDRWNPLWSDDTGAVVSRLVAPIAAGDGNARYYADLLQIHLGVIADGLQGAGLWPANVALLLEAAQLQHYDRLLGLVRGRCGEQAEITRRLRDHRQTISGPEGRRDLQGGTLRLCVVAGQTWRRVLTPDPERGAVALPAALAAGAVVLVRTWVDDLPEEAKAITTLFLADAAAAALALPDGCEWAALIDEFGGVLSSGAGERALALMQRARSAGGQVAVTTQSVSDFAAATGNPALLNALADNFAAGVVHRQSAPESRDWLARLIGTRELWQSTDRTGGAGAYAQGTGSRRRVREFLVRPDELRTLRVGEAIVWSTLGPAPERITVTPATLPPSTRASAPTASLYLACGPTRLPDPRRPPASPVLADDPSALDL